VGGIECNFSGDKTDTWYMTAHNPSTVDQNIVRFNAPKWDFTVYALDDAQEWQEIPSDNLCYIKFDNQSTKTT